VPRLPGQPGQGIETVFALIGVLGELAFRQITGPAVLEHRDIPVGGKEQRLQRQVFSGLAVGSSLQQDWKCTVQRNAVLGRQIDIGGHPDTIAHGDHDVGFGTDFISAGHQQAPNKSLDGQGRSILLVDLRSRNRAKKGIQIMLTQNRRQPIVRPAVSDDFDTPIP